MTLKITKPKEGKILIKELHRQSVRGLTIRYDNLGGGTKVVEGFKISAPLLLSPKDERKDGGATRCST